LVLLLYLHLVDHYILKKLLRVNTRIQTPEYLTDLTVETISGNFSTSVDVILSVFEVQLPVLGKTVQYLQYRIHIAGVTNVIDTCETWPIQLLLFYVSLYQFAQREVQIHI
jgi:hypothetical protein